MKLLKDMTAPELADVGRTLAAAVEGVLPPGPSKNGKCIFFLVYTDSLQPDVAQYVSNAARAGGIAMLRETADRLAKREDVGR